MHLERAITAAGDALRYSHRLAPSLPQSPNAAGRHRRRQWAMAEFGEHPQLLYAATSDAAHVCDLRTPSIVPATRLLPPPAAALRAPPPYMLAFNAMAVVPPPAAAPLLALASARELLLWDLRTLRAPVQRWNLPQTLQNLVHPQHFLSFGCQLFGGGLSLRLISRGSGLCLSFAIGPPGLCVDEVETRDACTTAAGEFSHQRLLQPSPMPRLFDGCRKQLRVLTRAESLLGIGAAVFPLAGGGLTPEPFCGASLYNAPVALPTALFALTREGHVLRTSGIARSGEVAPEVAAEAPRQSLYSDESDLDLTTVSGSRKCTFQPAHVGCVEAGLADLGKPVVTAYCGKEGLGDGGEEDSMERSDQGRVSRKMTSEPVKAGTLSAADGVSAKGMAGAILPAACIGSGGAGDSVGFGPIAMLRQQWHTWARDRQHRRVVADSIPPAPCGGFLLTTPLDAPIALTPLHLEGPFSVTFCSPGLASTGRSPSAVASHSQSPVRQLALIGRALIPGRAIIQSTPIGLKSQTSRAYGAKRRRSGGF